MKKNNKNKSKVTPYNKIECKVAAMWTRVSSDKQEKNNCSLDTQEKDIQDYAIAHNIRIKYKFGGKHESASSEGKEFKRMFDTVLNDIECNVILVWNYSRFSRTGAQAIVKKDLLKDCGKYVIAVKEEVDPDSSVGEFTEDLKCIFNKFENRQRRDACCAGMRRCIENGYWYVNPPINNDKNKMKILFLKGILAVIIAPIIYPIGKPAINIPYDT